MHLVGTNHDLIVSEVSTLLEDPIAYDKMSKAVNPYGDGSSAVTYSGRSFILGQRPRNHGITELRIYGERKAQEIRIYGLRDLRRDGVTEFLIHGFASLTIYDNNYGRL